MDTIYEFYYTSCIYESVPACVSLHRTRSGAECAMKIHKNNAFTEFQKLAENPDTKFGEFEKWGIRKRIIYD